MAAASAAAGFLVLVACTRAIPVWPAIGVPGAPGSPEVAGMALWVLVGLALSSFSVQQPGRAVLTFDHTALIAAAALGGPTAAAWVALLGTTEPRELRGAIPWWGSLSNHGQLVLSWAAAAAVMGAVGGGPLDGQPTVRSLAAVGAGVAVGFTVNYLLVAAVMAARTGAPPREALALPGPDAATVFAADAVVSWLAAVVYAAGAWWAALLVPVVDLAAGRSMAHHRASWLLGRHHLTDLPNAYAMEDRVRRLRRADARGLAVLFLDLDGFKAVNDVHGVRAGDEVLRAAGSRLEASCRESDWLFHLHGDEFVVIAAGVDTEAAAEALAARLVAAVEPPVDVGGALVSVSATVGIRLAPDAAAIDAAVHEADLRMSGAKDAKARSTGTGRRAVRASRDDTQVGGSG